MKKFIKSLWLAILFVSFLLGNFSVVNAQQKDNGGWWTKTGKVCTGIKLNTDFPIIGNCIESIEATNAFPMMMWVLTKIIISLVLVVCFIMIIVGWIFWAWDNPKKWQDIIKKVAITILLLWFSWVILRLINPNFFG